MNRIYLTFSFLCILKLGDCQTQWVRCPDNLVMMKNNDFYEGVAIGSPSVIYDSDTLKMLYGVGGRDSKGRISYAYSSDGISWVKYNNNIPVFDVSGPGNWDDFFLDTPDWLKDSSGYKLYYFGNTQNGAAGGSIGLATSPDGINWTRSGPQPVLAPGNPGDWDGLFIADPTVLFDGTSYFMWYTGADTTWQARIGFATSPDGFTWTKYGGNPVITGGNPQPNYSWEGFGVACPTVLKRNNKFEMYYCGVSWWDFADNGVIDTIKNGYATSTDGANWVKDPQNPLFNTYSAGYKITEHRGPWTPDAIFMSNESKYYLWYETAYGFGLATADDNSVSINNPHSDNNPVHLFPVPAASSLTIKISGAGNKDVNIIAFYNEIGQEVLRETLTGNVLHLDVSGLLSGIYLVSISNSKTFHSQKFQKL